MINPLLFGLSIRSWWKLLLAALICAALMALVTLLKPAVPSAAPATPEPSPTAFLTAVFLPTDPPPTEEPSPTPAVEPYVGYAVTTREPDLRGDVTLDDRSVSAPVPAGTLLYSTPDEVDMLTWSGAQTVMGRSASVRCGRTRSGDRRRGAQAPSAPISGPPPPEPTATLRRPPPRPLCNRRADPHTNVHPDPCA
jgi:hypothetical protein